MRLLDGEQGIIRSENNENSNDDSEGMFKTKLTEGKGYKVMKLFLDESGNTGTNWIDLQQPYFVYGGWLFRDDQCQIANDKINEIFSFSKASELKSKYILERKKNYFYDMMDFFLGDLRAIPMFVVVDKKYMVAAKIVETFFDNAYNPNINGYLTLNTPLKKALADIVYKDKLLITTFADALKKCQIDIIVITNVRNELAKYFRDKGLIEVESAIKNLSDDNLNEMVDEFLVMSKNRESKSHLSLTAPILMQLIINSNPIGHIYGETINVFLDKLPHGYENIICEIEQICLNKGIVNNISNIEMADSKSNRLVQAADLLSGYISRSLIDIDNKPTEESNKKLWETLVFLHDFWNKEHNIVIWDYDAHGEFIKKIGKLIDIEVPFKDDSINIIEDTFCLAVK